MLGTALVQLRGNYLLVHFTASISGFALDFDTSDFRGWGEFAPTQDNLENDGGVAVTGRELRTKQRRVARVAKTNKSWHSHHVDDLRKPRRGGVRFISI